ncbi:ring-exported protein 1, partial [Plasmodium reichenowi]
MAGYSSNEEEPPKEEKKISKLEDMQSPFDYKRFFRKYTIFAPFILVYFTIMFFVNSTVQNGTMLLNSIKENANSKLPALLWNKIRGKGKDNEVNFEDKKMIEGNKCGSEDEHNKHKKRKVDNQEDDYDVNEYGNPKIGAPYKSEEELAEQQNYDEEHHGDYDNEDNNEYHGKSNVEKNKDYPEQGQKDEEKEKEAKKKAEEFEKRKQLHEEEKKKARETQLALHKKLQEQLQRLKEQEKKKVEHQKLIHKIKTQGDVHPAVQKVLNKYHQKEKDEEQQILKIRDLQVQLRHIQQKIQNLKSTNNGQPKTKDEYLQLKDLQKEYYDKEQDEQNMIEHLENLQGEMQYIFEELQVVYDENQAKTAQAKDEQHELKPQAEKDASK